MERGGAPEHDIMKKGERNDRGMRGCGLNYE